MAVSEDTAKFREETSKKGSDTQARRRHHQTTPPIVRAQAFFRTATQTAII